jgi:hypothetical protein
MLTQLHLLKGFLQVGEGAVAPDSLERCQGGRLHGVSIVECFDGICVRAGRHQQVACVNVHQWILLVADDEFLEVMESQIVVTKKVSALTTEDVGFKK